MDEDALKKIKERFDLLPESIKEIIMSSNYQDDLIEISKKYGLNVEQMGILELETTMVMMGVTPTKDFQSELTRQLNVDMVVGAQIVADINVKIFLKIRELLKLMNTPLGEEPRVEEGSENPSEKILSAAGIPYRPPAGGATGQVKILEPDLTKPELPAGVGMLAQKLSGSFQIPSVKTEYTIPGVSKGKTENPVPKKPAVDPYRESTE